MNLKEAMFSSHMEIWNRIFTLQSCMQLAIMCQPPQFFVVRIICRFMNNYPTFSVVRTPPGSTEKMRHTTVPPIDFFCAFCFQWNPQLNFFHFLFLNLPVTWHLTQFWHLAFRVAGSSSAWFCTGAMCNWCLLEWSALSCIVRSRTRYILTLLCPTIAPDIASLYQGSYR